MKIDMSQPGAYQTLQNWQNPHQTGLGGLMGNRNLLSYIKSFAYRDKDGTVRINREKNYVEDLNSLPMPAWDLVDLNKFEMKLDSYYNPPKLPLKNKAAIFSSRACPLDCNFCDMFLVMGKKHRKRKLKQLVTITC